MTDTDKPEIAVDPLTLADVSEVEERVAVGDEIVPSHVRFVLAFSRTPTEDEVDVVRERLAAFDVVRSVTVEGVEVITADRETPGRSVPRIRSFVDGAAEEAATRAAEREHQRWAAEAASADLRDELRDQLA